MKDYDIKKDVIIFLLNKQISLHKHADAKAYFIFGVLGFIAWRIIPTVSNLSHILKVKTTSELFVSVLIILSIILLLISYIYAMIKVFNAIFPKVDSEKDTVVFFSYASKKTPEEVCNEIINTPDEEIIRFLTYDYNINSKITMVKFNSVQKAFISAFISLFAFMVLYSIANIVK